MAIGGSEVSASQMGDSDVVFSGQSEHAPTSLIIAPCSTASDRYDARTVGGGSPMTRRCGVLPYLFTFAIFAIPTHCAAAASQHKQSPGAKHAEAATGAGHKHGSAKPKSAKSTNVANDKAAKRKARKKDRAGV